MTTNRIDTNAPQMRCDMTVTERVEAQGNVRRAGNWNFSIK
ncbi:hypothetical protein [Bradyrhizobium arachidis]|nr:hypothetical protein [Bradyrhizobium arachidis]